MDKLYVFVLGEDILPALCYSSPAGILLVKFCMNNIIIVLYMYNANVLTSIWWRSAHENNIHGICGTVRGESNVLFQNMFFKSLAA